MDLASCAQAAQGLRDQLCAWSSAGHVPIRGIRSLIARPEIVGAAFHLVRDARGSGTPGVDGVTCRDIELSPGVDAFCSELTEALKQKSYVCSPLRGTLIPKDDGTMRELLIPTVRDRTVERLVAMVLDAAFDPHFRQASVGFRFGRGPPAGIDRLLALLSQRQAAVLVKIDIASFFPSVSHADVLEKVSRRVTDKTILHLVRSFMRRARRGLRPTRIGLAQGGPVSPVLTNIVADELDGFLADLVDDSHVRYVDDIVFVTSSVGWASRVVVRLEEFLNARGFTIAKAKTVFAMRPMRVPFLGHDFWLDDSGPMLEPSPSRVARMRSRLLEIANLRHVPATRRYTALEQSVAGWTNYYRPLHIAESMAAQAFQEAVQVMASH